MKTVNKTSVMISAVITIAGVSGLVATTLLGEHMNDNLVGLVFVLCIGTVILGIYLYNAYKYESLRIWLRNLKFAVADLYPGG